uniref:Uncharacterized protein n=1 Tax=Physcomitrium patens TaxID=3218 RepID=A0A2K1IBX4_PHYPA|nr:hypothetical protein PHYPA_030271 [Physcomitrium patens]
MVTVYSIIHVNVLLLDSITSLLIENGVYRSVCFFQWLKRISFLIFTEPTTIL